MMFSIKKNEEIMKSGLTMSEAAVEQALLRLENPDDTIQVVDENGNVILKG